MNLIERYKSELYGLKFTQKEGSVLVYTIGSIQYNNKVAIKYSFQKIYDISIEKIYNNITKGKWILTKESARKLKLKKLLNGFN